MLKLLQGKTCVCVCVRGRGGGGRGWRGREGRGRKASEYCSGVLHRSFSPPSEYQDYPPTLSILMQQAD